MASPDENQGADQPKRRGFAGMDPARQKQLASSGGKAAHESGRANEFTSESARLAGRKGGVSVSSDRAHMAAIGARGGEARGCAWMTEQERGFLLFIGSGGTVTHESGATAIELSKDGGKCWAQPLSTISRLFERGLITETANPPKSHTQALIRLTDRGQRRFEALRSTRYTVRSDG